MLNVIVDLLKWNEISNQMNFMLLQICKNFVFLLTLPVIYANSGGLAWCSQWRGSNSCSRTIWRCLWKTDVHYVVQKIYSSLEIFFRWRTRLISLNFYFVKEKFYLRFLLNFCLCPILIYTQFKSNNSDIINYRFVPKLYSLKSQSSITFWAYELID